MQIEAGLLCLAPFSKENKTPNFYSQITCPKHIRTAKTGREESNFSSVPILTVKTDREAVWKKWTCLSPLPPTESDSVLKSGQEQGEAGQLLDELAVKAG